MSKYTELKTIDDIVKAEDTYEVETGIKSKERVKSSGEVYTPDWVVNDMLNLIPTKDKDDQSLVDNEKKVISLDETYLEPACGNGNFLIRIIDRKLNRAVELGEQDINKNILKAYMTTYGVDIMADNVEESKARMLLRLGRNKDLVDMIKDTDTEKLIANVKFVMDRNIHWGNMLTGMKQISDGVDDEAINSEMTFIDWEFNGDELTTYMCPAPALGTEGGDEKWFTTSDLMSLERTAVENGLQEDGRIDKGEDGYDF